MVGNKPVSARFSLLPETKPRMGALGTSLIIQIALAAFLVSLPLLFPQQLIPKSHVHGDRIGRAAARYSDAAAAKASAVAEE